MHGVRVGHSHRLGGSYEYLTESFKLEEDDMPEETPKTCEIREPGRNGTVNCKKVPTVICPGCGMGLCDEHISTHENQISEKKYTGCDRCAREAAADDKWPNHHPHPRH